MIPAPGNSLFQSLTHMVGHAEGRGGHSLSRDNRPAAIRERRCARARARAGKTRRRKRNAARRVARRGSFMKSFLREIGLGMNGVALLARQTEKATNERECVALSSFRAKDRIT